MGVRIDRIIGVVLALIGVSMLLVAADLTFIADVVWSPRAVLDISLLGAIGIAAIAFGLSRALAKRR